MSANISVNLNDWNEVTNRAKSDANAISSRAIPQLDLLSNNIPDIFEIQQLINDTNEMLNRYKAVATKDIEKMQEVGTRAHATDSSLATAFETSTT